MIGRPFLTLYIFLCVLGVDEKTERMYFGNMKEGSLREANTEEGRGYKWK
jgi:hypothetical protein